MADGVKAGAHYEPGEDGQIRSTSTFISRPGESAATRMATYRESAGRYASIPRDMFG